MRCAPRLVTDSKPARVAIEFMGSGESFDGAPSHAPCFCSWVRQ